MPLRLVSMPCADSWGWRLQDPRNVMGALGKALKLDLQIGGHRHHQFVQPPSPLGCREVLDPDLQIGRAHV